VGEEYRSLSYSLWSFLHSPVTSSFLDPNILLKHPQPTSLHQCQRHHWALLHIKKRKYISVCVFD
jgi:hypothetical protein